MVIIFNSEITRCWTIMNGSGLRKCRTSDAKGRWLLSGDTPSLGKYAHFYRVAYLSCKGRLEIFWRGAPMTLRPRHCLQVFWQYECHWIVDFWGFRRHLRILRTSVYFSHWNKVWVRIVLNNASQWGNEVRGKRVLMVEESVSKT